MLKDVKILATSTGWSTSSGYAINSATAGYATSSGVALNADMWDGYQFSDFLNQAIRTFDGPSFNRITITISPGTAPFTVSSNTVVTLLNSDFWDGYHYSDLFPVQETHMFLNDVTTLNASITKHGFLSRLSGNAAQFLNGAGNFSLPTAGTTNDYSLTSFNNQTSVEVPHNFGSYPVVQVLSSTGLVTSTGHTIAHNDVNKFTVTFDSPASGNIIATLGSPQNQNIVTVSDNYAALATDRIIYVTAAGKIITLPVGVVGHEFVVDNGSSEDIYVIVTGGGTINSETSQTVPPDAAMHIYALTVNSYRIY